MSHPVDGLTLLECQVTSRPKDGGPSWAPWPEGRSKDGSTRRVAPTPWPGALDSPALYESLVAVAPPRVPCEKGSCHG